MRKLLWSMFALALAGPVACVTINVYFPEAAVEKAAEQFVDKVLGDAPRSGPAPTPAEQPPSSPPQQRPPAAMLLDFVVSSACAQAANLNVQSPQIQTIQSRMRARFTASLAKYFASGAIGFARDGTVAFHDAASVALSERAALNAAISDENTDRQTVYREIAAGNGHVEWEAQIRATFAKQWIERAKPGWYYQDAGGNWIRK